MGKAAGSTFARVRALDLSNSRSNEGSDFVTVNAPQPSPSSTSNRANQNAVSSQPSKTKDGPKQFEFVLVTDSESRRQVRRYAMRQYVHQRRLDGIARLESNKARVRGWSTTGSGNEATPPVASIKEEEDPESPNSKASSSSDSSVSSVDCAKSAGSTTHPSTTDDESFGVIEFLGDFSTSDPQAGPSSGTIDPFDSYPLALKEADQNLIPHFITRYPLMMYKMGHSQQYNPIRAIFHRVAIHDPVPFQAMLAVASKHMAGVQGQVETVQSLTHKMRALRLLNQRLKSDPGGKEEGTIYTAASMAVIEKWSKADNVENLHIRGLTQLLKRRGGMRGMRAASSDSQFMEKILYWVDFSCAPNAIVGASFPWTGETPDVPPNLPFMAPRLSLDPSIYSDSQDLSETAQSSEDFFSFFHSLNGVQQSLLGSPLVSEIEQPPPPRTVSILNDVSPLYCILTSFADYDHGIRDIHYIDEYCCMACLLYLNLALYDYYMASRNFGDYIEWINSEIGRLNPNGGASMTAILWIFLGNGGYPSGELPDDGERNWLVSRMLRVAKRFKPSSSDDMWGCLRTTLLEFLTIHQECGIGKSSVGVDELAARRRWRRHKPAILQEEAGLRQSMLDQLYHPLTPVPPTKSTISESVIGNSSSPP